MIKKIISRKNPFSVLENLVNLNIKKISVLLNVKL